MCGRACCTLNAAQVARACGLRDGDADSVRTVQMDRFRSSYNVSPGAYLPVFTARSDGQGAQVGEPRGTVHCMKWGLVPSFTKKVEKPDHYRMFNARSESVKEKASFRRLIPHNRCLVAVEGSLVLKDNMGDQPYDHITPHSSSNKSVGVIKRNCGVLYQLWSQVRFYEWKKDGSKKQPYYIHFKDGRPLVFAALYDSWENSEGEILHTFTILTTRSSSALEWLHDRMPVIFGSKDTIDMWLSNFPLKLETILTPYANFDLVWYPVTSAMGKPSFEGPECIKEIPLIPAVQNQISKLFSRKTDDNINKCKPDPEFGKTSDNFPKDENPSNFEESAVEDTKELADEKTHRSYDFPLPKKRAAGPELHGVKREHEEIGLDIEVKTEMSDSYSPSVKKKLQTGDKQASLLSYFGRT